MVSKSYFQRRKRFERPFVGVLKMKLSNQQAMHLFSIVKGTIGIKNVIGNFSQKTRLKIINEINDQQSRKIKELE